jgi:NitT/TauT family transport system permease protein
MMVSVLAIAMLWVVASLTINNEIILPRLDTVVLNMTTQLSSSSFYVSLAYTLWRMALGFTLALFIGVSLGFSSGMVPCVKDYLSPVVSMIKTIPNISYMIIALLWFTSNTSVIVVVFLIIFPMFYEASMSGVTSLRKSLHDVLLVYSETTLNQIIKVYIPAMLPFVLSHVAVALNLSFKVAIMAEVLGQPAFGIGKSMLLSKITLDMVDLFSWTGWIILLGLLFDYVLHKVINWINKVYLQVG